MAVRIKHKHGASQEGVMKAGQAHVLPIPVRAWRHVRALIQQGKHAKAPGHDWAFPSETKKGFNASASGVYRILYRLAAKDKEHKPRGELKERNVPKPTDPRRDLLAEAGIAWWRLHDPRRTLTKVLDEHGIPGGATVVLAHDIHEKEALAVTASERERADFQRLRTARITKMAYGGAQYLSLKKEAMTIWTNTLLDEYERQKAKARPSLKPPSDLHPIPVPDRFSTSGTGCQFSVPRPIILRRRNQPRELRTLLVIIVTFKMQSMTRLDQGPHDVSSRQPQNPLDVLHHSLSCRPHSATRLSSPLDRHNPPAAHRLLHREPTCHGRGHHRDAAHRRDTHDHGTASAHTRWEDSYDGTTGKAKLRRPCRRGMLCFNRLRNLRYEDSLSSVTSSCWIIPTYSS